MREREVVTSGVLEMTGEDGHRAHGEGVTSATRDTKYSRMSAGKGECTCGRFAELLVKTSCFSIKYEYHQHLTNLY